MEELAESGVGCETERTSETMAPRGIGARTNSDVEGARDTGASGRLLDEAPKRRADAGRVDNARSVIGGVLTDGRRSSRRLVDATNVVEPGTLVTTEAPNGNGAGTAAVGVERPVAAASVLGLVGGNPRSFCQVEPELDLSVENPWPFDEEAPNPMILDKPLVLGGFELLSPVPAMAPMLRTSTLIESSRLTMSRTS